MPGLRAIQTLLAIGLLSASITQAQIIPQRQTSVDLLVRVTLENDRAAGDRIRVELVSETGTPVSENYTNAEGKVTFHITTAGNYVVRASGIPIEGMASENVRIDDMDKNRTLFLHVRPKGDAGGTATSTKSNAPPVTTAAELKIPADAQKAFHKGMEAWEHNDYQKAAEYFQKAVTLYPAYDTAYNNLGVMFYQTNQIEKAREAFEKSVSLNDKNADADRNLARILIHDGNFARAEDLLKKSLMVEPLNPVTLTLLCVAEIESGDDEGALATARRAHQLPHEGYPLVHYVAGQALEREGKPQEACSEYQTYLREAPNGAEAGQVRSALARLTTGGPASGPTPQ
jgi:Tfp pilus assembly protein PilF